MPIENDIEQKGVKLHAPAPVQSLGQQFVKSDEYAAFQKGQTQKARVELKNTVLADSTTTTTPQYQPGVVAGAFRPLTINDVLPQYQTSTDLVVLTREASFTNNAAPQTEGAAKAQSAITMPTARCRCWHWRQRPAVRQRQYRAVAAAASTAR